MDPLLTLLDGWKPRRIAVVGDFILDRFTYGNAERLSRDAPVPVLAAVRHEHAPGGASNVCRDLAALRCKVDALGVVGSDSHGKTLKQALREDGINVAGLVTSSDRPTTVKHNFIGLAQHRHPQKMFRLDDESREPIPLDAFRKIIAKLEKIIDKLDVVCLADYNIGVCTTALCQSVIRLAKKHRVPVLVDPAAISDYSKYDRATAITPNRNEAALATGDTSDRLMTTDRPLDLLPLGRKLIESLHLEYVVLTLDRLGMLLISRGTQATHVPTRAREVHDVSGAGDMVLAMLAAAIANKAPWKHAIELANVAAGLEVERFGVVPIALEEVLLALLQQRGDALGKVRTLDQLVPEIQAYRHQGRRIAFTNGCFDILHAGHVSYLRDARTHGDLLIVAVNSDASIRRIKADSEGPPRPVNREADRVLVLSELESVSYVVVFDEDTPLKLIEALKPDVLIKGADYKKHQVVGHEIVEAHGGKVVLVPLVKGRSTTNILRKLASGASGKGGGA